MMIHACASHAHITWCTRAHMHTPMHTCIYTNAHIMYIHTCIYACMLPRITLCAHTCIHVLQSTKYVFCSRTMERWYSSLVAKRVVFLAIAYFMPLFYTAFYQLDVIVLKAEIASLFMSQSN